MNASTRLSTANLADILNHMGRVSVGFDNMFDTLHRVTNSVNTQNYPPHDIVKRSDTCYTIRVAVAGFREEELDVSVEDNILTIAGSQKDRPEEEYVFHGISNKAFEKRLSLAEHVVVRDAKYDNGLLEIDLEVVIPEALKPRKISISSSKQISQ